ncbi:long-chain acyl-CoA synthetase [Prevotella aff. ruminicola Tc2-24]|uniref:Long-chain acyl-CoA synthetase n=1 Tax=Prevotella aff. ruminicola Tc2-24 TaxID=81582 RepID=A0A1I0M176_9BACT|nr:AMP-binding protein [Prevotella aff. ruminicola Tc2-24]SEV81904.1 long-chain acyl-CoA synthetase [Prevotella aff. ruminicola Tc2-24]
MENFSSFNAYIQRAIIDNWNQDALTDYQGITLQFHDVARKIEKLHILFENSGVQKGDKIALCGRNSAHWAVAFLATLTYGAVAVPILHEFNGEQIQNIVNHSESKLLFIGDFAVKTIDPEAMPALEAIINIPDFSLMISRSEKVTYAREHLNMMFGSKYPRAFRAEHVSYHVDEAEELALINYTSGTTGFSKGVMLPYRTLWGNIEFVIRVLGKNVKRGDNMLSILPMAHMYGMAIEFLFGFCNGCHLFFLTRLPSPAIIAEAFATVKPSVIITVPLIIEKIIRKKVFPKIQDNRVRLLLAMPVVSKKVKKHICQEVYNAFGGNLYEVIVGGAPLSKEVEEFLLSIGFPITVGYGTTECAPLISFSDYKEFISGSCGTPVDRMEVRILSNDPQNIPGEIVTRGTNLMTGYFKNQEATDAAIDEEGWYHTGDLGTMSEDGHIFIRGRIKNMLLGANGQNVYPEEIEDKLNAMVMVSESLVIQRGDKLVALVYPDKDEVVSFSKKELANIMEQNRQELNNTLPVYSRISAIELQEQEFEKTPKKSIKRYLYKNN